jgi:hypothetical protein
MSDRSFNDMNHHKKKIMRKTHDLLVKQETTDFARRYCELPDWLFCD